MERYVFRKLPSTLTKNYSLMAIFVRVIKLFATNENCSATHTRKHYVENEIKDQLIKEGNRKVVTTKKSQFLKPQNLPQLLQSYLNLLFTRDKNKNITTKLCGKCDTFSFHIANIPFM